MFFLFLHLGGGLKAGQPVLTPNSGVPLLAPGLRLWASGSVMHVHQISGLRWRCRPRDLLMVGSKWSSEMSSD